MRRTALAALLLATTWAAQAQNLTVRVNNGAALTGQASLEAAITASGVALGSIATLEITAGTFAASDWTYLKSSSTQLNRLKSFTITDGIAASGRHGQYKLFCTLFRYCARNGEHSQG
ncbi:MAG: hypothetical protein IJU72_05855 [Bacteroidales bacterium]|nr:hypothetical protein [Bacteroidales bacterium]